LTVYIRFTAIMGNIRKPSTTLKTHFLLLAFALVGRGNPMWLPVLGRHMGLPLPFTLLVTGLFLQI
jgi:hypothetical protein